MNLPLVAVVGRPNVGKSTFFNRIAGRRISIVEDKPGVTRDRLYADCEWCGYHFTLIDTGGLETKSDDRMWNYIKAQAEFAVDTADVILFFTDGKEGLLPGDYDVADYLRMSGKPVVLAVNKLDNNEVEKTYEFYALGIGDPIGISCEQSKGLGDLLDAVVEHFDRIEIDEENRPVNIAVVGKPNAGKSSIVNRLLGYDRVIVSDIAGTTRDAIDTPFEYGGRKFNLIDTAGMRRKRSIDERVESYSVMRALAAIRRSDVVLLVVDSAEAMSEQTVRIAGYIHEQGKPSVILMNKWDLVEKDTYTVQAYERQLKEQLKFMDYFVSMYVSAAHGKRTDKIMDKAIEVLEQAEKRITTGVLNDVISDATAVNEPPSKNGKKLKIYFVTQAATCPPTFIFQVNDRSILHFSYERYLENRIRDAFGFTGTPIRLFFRDKSDQDAPF